MTTIRYGGQAVIEGVMMSGPKGKAIAVRNEDGCLVYKIEDKKPLAEQHALFRLPVVRGVANFCASMVGGIRDLTWSAAQAGETEDEKLSAWEIFTAVLTALVFSVLVFIVFPVFLATWLHQYVGDFGRSLIEGLLRAGLFLGYVLAISRMNDIKRLFAYHGAEHKTINAYEAGVELTPENVRQYSRIHVRCGTSFLMMVMLLMIVFFTFVGQTDAVHRILIKIICLPLIAGLSYELFRLPLKYPNSKLVRILVAPGLAMQGLTTREPDDSQIETAIAALRAVPGFAGSEIDAAAAKARAQRSRRSKRSRRAAVQQQPMAAEGQPALAERQAAEQGEMTEETTVLYRSMSGHATQPAAEMPAAAAEDAPQQAAETLPQDTVVLDMDAPQQAAAEQQAAETLPQDTVVLDMDAPQQAAAEQQAAGTLPQEIHALAPVTETAVTETAVAETAVAETAVAETAVAETAVTETAVAETAVAETDAQRAQPLQARLNAALEQAGTKIAADAAALHTRLAPAMHQARLQAQAAGRQAAALARKSGRQATLLAKAAGRKTLQLSRTASRKAIRVGRITGCAVCLLADEAAGAVKRIVNEAERRSAHAADTPQTAAPPQNAAPAATEETPSAAAAEAAPASRTESRTETAPELRQTENGKEED